MDWMDSANIIRPDEALCISAKTSPKPFAVDMMRAQSLSWRWNEWTPLTLPGQAK